MTGGDRDGGFFGQDRRIDRAGNVTWLDQRWDRHGDPRTRSGRSDRDESVRTGPDRPKARGATGPEHRQRSAHAAQPSRRAAIGRTQAGKRRRGPEQRRLVADLDLIAANLRSAGRLTAFAGVAVVLFAVVVLKLIDVQFTQREYWQSLGESNRIETHEIRVERGGVFDRNGNILAMSVYRPNVVADPTEVDDEDAMARRLAPILGVPEEQLLEQLSQTNQYQLLARNVGPEVRDELVTGDRATPYGIYYEDGSSREYPGGELARDIIGSVYEDGKVDENGNSGRSGLERRYDDELLGKPGEITYEKDASGGKIAGSPVVLTEPTPGLDIHLTIDQDLQFVTQETLTRRIQELGASEGTAIIMRPSTGEVLTMVTVAVTDDGKIEATRDTRSVGRIFESGSVMKAFTIAGAMEAGVVGPDTQRVVPDHVQMYDKPFTDHSPHPDQIWSTTDIISNSSNVGTIQIARELGAEGLHSQLEAFGFGNATGIDIDGEVNGLLPEVEDWSGTSIGSIAIGQTIAVTPIQLATAYGVFSNGGIYVPPRIVGAVDSGNGPQQPESQPSRRVISAETAAQMEAMLGRVVTDGTGRDAAVPGFAAFGKTGTARIPQDVQVDPNDAYVDEFGNYSYMSTFVGGVRGADLTVLVTFRDPQNETSGGAAAAPVFSQLAALALRTLHIPPTVPGADPTVQVPELSTGAREEVGDGPSPVAAGGQG